MTFYTRALIFFLPSVILLLAPTPGHAQTQPGLQPSTGRSSERASFQPRVGGPKYAPDRLIVRFHPGTPKFRSDAAHAAIGARSVRAFKAVRDLEVVRLPEGTRVEEALRTYRKDPTVLYAEPDYVVHALQNPVTPNDPRFSELWGLQRIQAPQAWGITTGSPQVVVAVIDTGTDYNHEDLSANMFRNSLDCNSNGADDDGNGFVDDCYGIDAANGDSDPMDDNGHGTHVSGTIGAAGNNGVGVVGVNWNVSLLACKFLDWEGHGFTSGAVTCLDYLASMKERGVNIVATNNSWGGGDFSRALLDAIDLHRQRGILFIAAAGNDGSDNDASPSYPDGYFLPNVISVGATERTADDRSASFSNFGRRSVHLGAPGVGILSTTPGNTYDSFSGTSMAAPHVTGVAALLAAQDSTRDWKAIKNLLLAGGDSRAVYWDSVIGDYRLNRTVTRKHLNAYGAMTCSDSPVLSRLQPRTNAITSVSGLGLTVDLAMLHINCAAPGGNVTVLVDGGVETITLLDDGQGTDQEAGDGIYSGQWVLPASWGTHTLTIPNAELDLDTDAAVVVDDVISVQILSPYRFSTNVGFNYRSIVGNFIDFSPYWDDGSALISSSFPIPFGGGSFTGLFVNTNGNITFNQASYGYFNQPIPAPPNFVPSRVAPLWDDLYPVSISGVFWDVIGSPPNRELVVEWRGINFFDCTSDFDSEVTFQVVFFEGSSDILFNYLDVNTGPDCPGPNLGASATVGVQVSSQVGTQFSFNTPALADNMAILWTLGAPNPSISRLAPFSAAAGDPGFTLQVFGMNFVPLSQVHWNGSPRSTTFVNSNQLTATIPAGDLGVAGTVQVSVSNPEPGGGTSNELPLTVYSSYPVPSLTSLSPSQVVALGCQVCTDTSFTLTVTGTDFVSSSVVRWNGADRPTTVLSATQVQAEIPFADVADGGLREITVFNPAPGGGVSNPLVLAVENPAPLIAFAEPTAVPGVGFTLRVASDFRDCNDPANDPCYSTFVPSSVVRWNGANRPTTFINEARLEAAIPASDLPGPGTAEITVFNPAPGGGISNAVPIDIVPRPPNDDFANALAISTLPLTHTVDIRTATVEPADLPFMGQALSGGCLTIVAVIGDPGDIRAGNTVWYKFTPQTTMTVRANMFGTNYHAYMAALTGTPGSLALLRCTQSTWSPPYDEHEFTAQAGRTYYFVIGDYSTSGTLVFNLSSNAPAPQATLSPSDLTFAPVIVNTTSAAQVVTLTNTGGAPLAISSMTFGGPNAGHFTKSDNCGASLNPGASCSINVATRPTEAGPCTASLTITHNASGGPSTVAISGMATDFSVSPASGSTTSATVNAGQAATYSLNLAGTSGFSGSVGLACSGAPNAATCTVSPSALNLDGTTPVAATVTVTTTARAALPPLGGPSNAPLRVIPLPLPALLALTALLFFSIGFRSRRFAVRASAFALTTVFALLLLSSCGGGGSSAPPPPRPPVGTQPGTYTITVTATSAGASRTLPLTLTVR